MVSRLIFLFIFFLFSTSVSFAQSDGEAEVRKAIETFFKGFHDQDSLTMKSVVGEEIKLQTMGYDREGNSRLRTDSFQQFLNSITSIPDSLEFREELLGFDIRIDQPMANAWTPYRFWINGELSHCGVNSFQLFHDGSGWKIIYLADTRRRKECD